MNVTKLVLFVLNLSSFEAHAESYAEVLQKITGLRSGTNYRLAPDASQSPDMRARKKVSECMSGTLEIVDAGAGAASVLFETNGFIDAIGPGSDSAEIKKDDRCPTSRPFVPDSSLRAGHLDGKKVETCPHRTYTWIYSIEVNDRGLTYTLNRNGDKEICVLVKE